MTWNAPTSSMITAANRIQPTHPEASVDMDAELRPGPIREDSARRAC